MIGQGGGGGQKVPVLSGRPLWMAPNCGTEREEPESKSKVSTSFVMQMAALYICSPSCLQQHTASDAPWWWIPLIAMIVQNAIIF